MSSTISISGHTSIPTTRPTGKLLTREVFSAKFGVENETNGSGAGYYPPPPSSEYITQIQGWAGSCLDAIQVWYGDKSTPKMGGDGGVWQGHWMFPPYQLFDIDSINCEIQDQVTIFRLHFKDGTEISKGGNSGTRQEVKVPDEHYLSSINVISKFYDNDRGWLHDDQVRTMYFGFRLKPDGLSTKLPEQQVENEVPRVSGCEGTDHRRRAGGHGRRGLEPGAALVGTESLWGV